ncbi:MAG: OpgC domain-containing protein [Spirochaetota bacterium]|nr:OpgC domain-containing protein [Spirochaetota bacterium]
MIFRDNSLDFLKGTAMILVILTHIIPGDIRFAIYDSFYIIQAVPIFVFISSY